MPTPTLAAPTATPLVATPTATTVPSPRPAIVPTATSAPRSANAATLPTLQSSASQSGPGFLTPVELALELQQPVTDTTELRKLVDGVQALDGVASVRSDGLSVEVRYDSTRVLPARIRQRLTELGHPARAGTDVQNPGDAAD